MIPEYEPAPFDRSMSQPALRGLAKRTGKTFGEIINLADANRLGELFDERGDLIETDDYDGGNAGQEMR